MLLCLQVDSSKCFPVYSVSWRQACAVAGHRQPADLAAEDADFESWAQPQGSLAVVSLDSLPVPALHVLWGPLWESFLGFGLGWALAGETTAAASGTSLGQRGCFSGGLSGPCLWAELRKATCR